MRQVRELFLQFRQIYRKLEKKVQETGSAQKKAEGGSEEKKTEVQKEKGVAENKGVGENEETAAGFGIGKALKESKPKQPVDVAGKPKKVEADEEEDNEGKSPGEESKEEPAEEMPGTEMKTKKEKKVEVLDRQTVFELKETRIGFYTIQEGGREIYGRRSFSEPEGPEREDNETERLGKRN